MPRHQESHSPSCYFSFDWFSVTVHGLRFETVFEAIFDLAFPQSQPRQKAGRHSYTHGCEFVSQDGEKVFARMDYGGTSATGIFCEVGSSDSAGALIGAIRELKRRSPLGEFHVKRLDSCVDFRVTDQGDWFRKKYVEIVEWRNFRRGRALALSTVGKWPDSRERTLYIGNRKQPCFVRFYEKGWQMVGEKDKFWTRLEVEYKPRGGALRQSALAMSPRDIFAMGFAQDLGTCVFDFENIGKYSITPPRKRSSQEKKLEQMLIQYGAILFEAWDSWDGDAKSFLDNLRAMTEEIKNDRQRDVSAGVQAPAA